MTPAEYIDSLERIGEWPDGEYRIPNTTVWINMWDAENGYNCCSTVAQAVKFTMELFRAPEEEAITQFFKSCGYRE